MGEDLKELVLFLRISMSLFGSGIFSYWTCGYRLDNGVAQPGTSLFFILIICQHILLPVIAVLFYYGIKRYIERTNILLQVYILVIVLTLFCITIGFDISGKMPLNIAI